MDRNRRFEEKTVLVTGASSGIGRSVAVALGRERARVVIAGRRRDRLEQLAADIAASGGEALVATGDVRERGVPERWVAESVGRFGGLDGLVNAAGVIGNGSVMAGTDEEWERIMDSNLHSVFRCIRAASGALRERRGAIVNLSSVAAVRPYAGLAGYCVSKAAVDMLTRCAALDLAPDGVRVNAVNPGVVVTELHTVSNAVADYAAFLDRGKTTHPLGRVGQPEEVAALVLFLLSSEAGWITGDCVGIDGGRALSSLR